MTRQERQWLRARFDKAENVSYLWRQIIQLCDDLDETERRLERILEAEIERATGHDFALDMMQKRKKRVEPCSRCNGRGEIEIDVPEGSTAGGWTECPECKS